MRPAFVIMQIGNPELDRVYEGAVAPALVACGFAPRRVDRHNRGGLLVSEIIAFIDEAELLVADVTHERPNCYLEIGYAIGVNKLTELILTARADHDPHGPSYRPGGPRVHFDLAGFDILFWQPERLPPRAREAHPAAPRAARVSRARGVACVGLALGLALAFAPLVHGCASRGTARIGGLEPYRVNGKRYVPLRDWKGYREEGVASWYGAAHHGRRTANGERFDAHGALTAAHKTLPFNVCAEVENLRTGRSVVVRINDRGPFAKSRVIDLSKAAASEIGLVRSGVARVRVEAVGVADAKGSCRGV